MQNEPEVTKASVYRPPAQRNGNSGDYPRDSRDSDRRYDSRDNWNDRRGYDSRDNRNGYGGRDRGGGGGFWSRDSDRRGSDYDRRGGYDNRRRDYDDNYSRDNYSRSRDYDRRDYDRRPNDENPPQTDSRWRDLDSDRRDDRSNGHYRGGKGGSRDGRYYDGPRDRDRYDDGPRDGGRDGPDGDRRGSDRRPESRNDTPEATEADETWSQLQPRDERLEKELFAGALSGINFDKYDDIPVSTSGENVPEPKQCDLLSEAKQDVPDKLKQIARAYHDNGGRRPPKENNRNANGFGSTDIREKAKNGDKPIQNDRLTPPVTRSRSKPMTRSRFHASKTVLLNSPWTNEKRKKILQKKIRPIRDKDEDKENSTEPGDLA